jgi:hypothetical protein
MINQIINFIVSNREIYNDGRRSAFSAEMVKPGIKPTSFHLLGRRPTYYTNRLPSLVAASVYNFLLRLMQGSHCQDNIGT